MVEAVGLREGAEGSTGAHDATPAAPDGRYGEGVHGGRLLQPQGPTRNHLRRHRRPEADAKLISVPTKERGTNTLTVRI